MTWKLLAAAAVALALLAFLSAFEPAEARRGHGGHFRMGGGHHHFGIRHARIHRFAFRHHRFHRRRFVVAGFYGYHRRCAWLRHRALVTGSPYWWRRYWACRHHRYYRYY